MKVSEEFLQSRALSCLLSYRINGLNETLNLLKSICSEFTQVDRINVAYIPSDLSAVINLADTHPRYRLPLVPRREGAQPPLLLWDRIREKLLIGNLDIYQKDEMQQNPELRELPMMEHRSLIRIPVCITDDYTFLFNFWSDRYDQFTAEDLASLEVLTEPLNTELTSYYTRGFSVLPSVRPPQSGYERLVMCPGLFRVRDLVERVARFSSIVLILGETGTGKETVADSIHELSPRRAGPLLKINCGSIPETLLESELFGYEKNAFTGAASTRKGFFEMANGGTLILDEIGEMSLAAQVRLLRVLETSTIMRVGGREAIPVDVRIVASTHDNLPEKVRQGKFREDLWYRLSVFPIHVPPLRERPEDFRVLVRHFIQKKNREFGLSVPEEIREHDMQVLVSHHWPGNIRELEHVVERAMILWKDGSDSLHVEIDPLPSARDEFSISDWPTLEELEARYIKAAVRKCGGKLSGPQSASELLGIHYTTLHTKMKKNGL